MLTFALASGLHDGLSAVFGGWTNFTQGAAGALVGVLGAYVIAAWTARREVGRDRQRAREDAGVAAAGELIRVLLALRSHVRRVKHLEWSSGSGIATKHLIGWEERRDAVSTEVMTQGTLLPTALEVRATALVDGLGVVMDAEFDPEDGYPVLIDTAKPEVLDGVIEYVEALIEDLQDFRRNPKK